MNGTLFPEEGYILSIIIPVYNTACYIEKCLLSCLNQNVSHYYYEIICVDDGSTDNSVQLISKMEEQYSNITLIKNAHQGVSGSRNIGLKSAKGKYVWFVDSDDLIVVNSLAAIIDVISKTNTDELEFYSYGFVDIEPNVGIINSKESVMNLGHYNNGTRIFRREVITNNNLSFYYGMSYGEDTLFLTEFREKAFSQTKICYTAYLYRKTREDSAINSVGKRMGEWANSLYDAAIYIHQKVADGDYVKKETIMYLFSIIQKGIEVISNLSIDEANQYIEKYEQSGLFNSSFLKSVYGNNAPTLEQYYNYRKSIHPEEKNLVIRVLRSIWRHTK